MKLTRQELRRIREEKGLSFEQMAERLQCSVHNYREIEKGALKVPKRWVDGRFWLFRNYTEV